MFKFLHFSVTIDKPVSYTFYPEKKVIVNSIDRIGILLGTKRIVDESNADFKKRIWDASVHPSGPAYSGVVNGLTRDFGFLLTEVIKIELKLNSDGSSIALNPRVDMFANRIVLYNDWRSSSFTSIDKEIRIYKEDDEGYYLHGLIDEINKSKYFMATLLDGVRPNLFSTCLKKASSATYVSNEPLVIDRRQTLRYKNIVDGSIVFSDTRTFNTEKFDKITSYGDYLVDYENGVVFSMSLPTEYSSCSYYTNRFPFTIEASPIQVFSINDDNYTTELFKKEILDSEEAVNSLLNEEGTVIYNQVFLNSRSLWGE